MLIYDSKKCIKNIQASSREDVAQSLFESVGGFWQSSGSIGKVRRRMRSLPNIKRTICPIIFKIEIKKNNDALLIT